MLDVSPERIAQCYDVVRTALLAERRPSGHWTGELSTSALSTATACMALEMVRREVAADRDSVDRPAPESAGHGDSDNSGTLESLGTIDLRPLIEGGLDWLAEHQNHDGGWGDTTKSVSNISTTMLAHATFHATGAADRYPRTVEAAHAYIDRAGGVEAVLARYGKDKTFSIPILTHCALAGVVEWNDVLPLPFELACIPARFYKMVRLPVVSYALPALIAIGQVHYHHCKPWNPILRWIRQLAAPVSLRILERIQPTNGGFLEAAPLTSFVTMSLAAMGRADHPVVRRGVRFLVDSVRPDGSWPIDTNLATWLTTLSIHALGNDLPADARPVLRNWLLKQQFRELHPYTNADPGGWAWTDLPGGVPDADDTSGAILALLALENGKSSHDDHEAVGTALVRAIPWLLDLQNRDRGWPTFCRGWGTLPFDRSAADISAHVLRALVAWLNHPLSQQADGRLRRRAKKALRTGFKYLAHAQNVDGSWLPLWFGNQHAPGNSNPTYGTARVLAAYQATGRMDAPPAQRGREWLRQAQNADGGWGGAVGVESSLEETSLAVEALLAASSDDSAAQRGLAWLMDRVECGCFRESTPIGFYFAELWYFESLYPLTFLMAALSRAHRIATHPRPARAEQPDLTTLTQ